MYALSITADLGGSVYRICDFSLLDSCADIFSRVTNLRPDDSEANPFWYTFQLQCTSCRETHENWVGVNRFVCLKPL